MSLFTSWRPLAFISLALFYLSFGFHCASPHISVYQALCPPSFRRLSPEHCFPNVARRGRIGVTVSDVVRLLLLWPCDRRPTADRVTAAGLVSLTTRSRCVDNKENCKKDFFLRWSSCLWDRKQKLVLTRDPRRRLRAPSEAERGRPQMVMLRLVLHSRTLQGLAIQQGSQEGAGDSLLFSSFIMSPMPLLLIIFFSVLFHGSIVFLFSNISE